MRLAAGHTPDSAGHARRTPPPPLPRDHNVAMMWPHRDHNVTIAWGGGKKGAQKWEITWTC
eukprot:206743-Rhodomonas_salina.1